MNSIFHRTSIRRYTAEPVSAADVEQLMRAAMAAPSACNQQPWEFYVVTKPEKIQQLAECSHYAKPCKGAPLVIVPCMRKLCQVPQYAQIDLSAATENILLEADTLGLGAVWIGIAPREVCMNAVRGVLNLPDHLDAFCLIACGHPAEERKQQDRYEEKRVHLVD